MTKVTSVTEFTAPLGSVEAGRLVFIRGASHLAIRTDRSMEDLYRARFEGKSPEVGVDGGTVTVKYRGSFRPPHGEITLSGRIPWAIEWRWGMSDVTADLGDLELKELQISGGASRIEVMLPRPKGSVGIRIGGGASHAELVRPVGVPVRVRIGAGAAELAIDDFSVGSVGGKTDQRSPDYDVAEDRYDIEVGAGASKLTIRT